MQRNAYQDTHIVIEVGDTVFKDFLDEFFSIKVHERALIRK